MSSGSSFGLTAATAVMIRSGLGFCDSRMTEKSLDLRGLKCPLPVLRTRKALGGLQPGDLLLVSCTDPLAGIDLPVLVRQMGDALEGTSIEPPVTTFRIRKR